jgi:hypothetical protein
MVEPDREVMALRCWKEMQSRCAVLQDDNPQIPPDPPGLPKPSTPLATGEQSTQLCRPCRSLTILEENICPPEGLFHLSSCFLDQ